MSLGGPPATSAAVSSGALACPSPYLPLTLAALHRTPRSWLTRASTTSGSGAHRSASMRAARVCEKYLAPISSVIYMLKPHPSSTPLLLTFPLTCPLASNPSCTAQDCPRPHLRRAGAGAVGTSMEGQLAVGVHAVLTGAPSSTRALGPRAGEARGQTSGLGYNT